MTTHSSSFTASLLYWQRIVRLVLATLLASLLLPAVAFGTENNDAPDSNPPIPTSVPETSTASESYAEGRAIALVSSPDGIMAQSASTLLAQAEPLMAVSAETVQGVVAATNEDTTPNSRLRTLSAPSEGTLVIVSDATKTTEQLIEELEADPSVIFAEPDYNIAVSNPENPATPAEETVSQQPEPTSTPTADLTSFQWANSNSSNLAGPLDNKPDINYADWNKPSTSTDTTTGPVIALIDSGADAAHPDLASKMWAQGDQYPALLALGGDKYGFSCITGKTSTTNLDDGHGTHCAGNIAAAWDNAGISGVSQNASIMVLRYDSSVSGTLACFNYAKTAIEEGVDLRAISNSWGFGYGASKAINVAVTEVGTTGNHGAVSLFASGNASINVDYASETITTLRDNPYAIIVGSNDPSGEKTGFSNYGNATTDIMAGGVTSLSTWNTNDPGYIAEADASALEYESFDSATRPGDRDLISFSGATGTTLSTERSFEGNTSLKIDFKPTEDSEYYFLDSDVVDLSELADKPSYVSMRFSGSKSTDAPQGTPYVFCTPFVRTTDGEWTVMQQSGLFNAVGSAWGGGYAIFPENTDWKNFCVSYTLTMVAYDLTGSQGASRVASGSIYVDSFGLGSDCIPYAYSQGTSMACPVAAGAAAVISESYPNDSAEKLAARVKGSAVPSPLLTDLCSTGGYVSVDTADTPAPSIVSVDSDGENVSIIGYFMDNTSVTIAGENAHVSSIDNVGNEKSILTGELPSGYTGGEAEICATNSRGSGRAFAALMPSAPASSFYDSLPLPEGIDMWSSWQLVGFGGYVYCLPGAERDYYTKSFFRYDPQTNTWSNVALPPGSKKVLNMTAAVCQGKMLIQADDGEEFAYWLYNLDGSWQELDVKIQDDNPPETRDKAVILPFSTLCSDGTYAYLFGGIDQASTDSSQILRIDIATGIATYAGALNMPRPLSNVSYSNGVFLVAGGGSYYYQLGGLQGIERVTADSSGLLSGTPVDYQTLVTETGQLTWTPAGLADGFLIAGPQSNAGKHDMYALATDAQASLRTDEKRVSDIPLTAPHATAYNGKVYVLAAQSEGDGFVFASSDATTQTIDLREAQVAAVPDQTFTGAEIKPALLVTLGTQTLIPGEDYTVAYTNNVETGTATATITGIGNFAGMLATSFTIAPAEPQPNPSLTPSGENGDNSGQTIQPLPLAATSDDVGTPAVTLAFFLIAGLGFAALARRKIV